MADSSLGVDGIGQVLPIGASPCPKCAPGTDVSVSYHPRRSYCAPYSRYTFNSRADEHLHYRCRNCGYDWTGDVAGPSKTEIQRCPYSFGRNDDA